MNKDFMMGAELALRGAGIKDEQTKQQLMAKLTNAQIAKMSSELQTEQDFQKYAQNFMQPRMPDTSGASGYVPEGFTPQGMTQQPSLTSPEFLQGAMKYLTAPQAVTAATALSNKEQNETPQQRLVRELMVARENREGKDPNAFTLFYRTMKAKGMPDDEIDKVWTQRQLEQVQLRYPPYGQLTDLPPGYTLNRIDGRVYGPGPDGKPIPVDQDDLPDLFTGKAELVANKTALREITKRSELIKTFTTRIEANSPIVIELAKKVGNLDTKLLNVPINELFKRQIIGSGELMAYRLALTSLSNEIAKVESGSIGIAGASVDQMNIMAKIHDPNLSVADMQKIVDTGVRLGKTSENALEKQRVDLVNRTGKSSLKPSGSKTTEISDEQATAELLKRGKKVTPETIQQAKKLMGGK